MLTLALSFLTLLSHAQPPTLHCDTFYSYIDGWKELGPKGEAEVDARQSAKLRFANDTHRFQLDYRKGRLAFEIFEGEAILVRGWLEGGSDFRIIKTISGGELEVRCGL